MPLVYSRTPITCMTAYMPWFLYCCARNRRMFLHSIHTSCVEQIPRSVFLATPLLTAVLESATRVPSTPSLSSTLTSYKSAFATRAI